jgi:hypothetical protein
MNTIRIVVAMIALLPALARAQVGTPATNAFSFQGQLSYDGMPVDIALEVTFQLFSSPTGNMIPDVVSPLLTRTVQFDDRGRFTVLLDFGQTYNGYPIFNGDERYMQIIILDPPGGIEEDFPLSPRVKLAATPMAAYALNARIPSFAEISGGTLESTDANGSLAINTLDDDLGLTIRPNGGVGALFTYSGTHANDPFAISTTQGPLSLLSESDDLTLTSSLGNIKLNAPLGEMALIADDRFSIATTMNGTMDINSSGITLDALNINLDASATVDISSAASVSIASAGILTLTSSIATINGNQFDGASVIINKNLLATVNASKPGGGPWSVLSDRRFKRNITPLHGSLDTLLALRPVSYEYSDTNSPMYLPGKQTGFVAQEVREVLPTWIDQSDDGTLLLTPRGFEAMVVDAMRELDTRREREIESLRAQNEELRERLDRLERLLLNRAAE